LASSPVKDDAKNTLSAKWKGRFFSNTLKANLDRTKRRQSNFAEKITRVRKGTHIEKEEL